MGAPSKLRLGGKPRTLASLFQLATKHGCPIQAPLGWETANPGKPLSTHHKTWVPHPSSAWVGNREPWQASFNSPQNMGAPSKLRLGGKPRTLASLFQLTTKHGCPIQAPLGWETANPGKPLSTRHKTWVPHPSSAWVGYHEPWQPPLSTHHKTWVPHPSSAWVGNHEPWQASFNSPQNMGAPSKLRLGGKSRTLASLFQLTTKHGCPIQAPLGWETTNPGKPLSTHHKTWVPHPSSAWVGNREPWQASFNSPQNMGAPSKLRLGGKPRTLASLFQLATKHGCPIQAPLGWETTNHGKPLSTHHKTWVPHPSSARVGYHKSKSNGQLRELR